MAFKFKVKKRPNLGQAVASSFAAGAVQGGQMALQKMLQEREENKNKSNNQIKLFVFSDSTIHSISKIKSISISYFCLKNR